MRVVAAPDKLRGTATAIDAAASIARAARSAGWECDELPVADGGEGTLDVLGGANRTTTVTGPLGEPVVAGWRMTGPLAVIEMSQASGLVLAGGADGNDPVGASSVGTGELVAAALDAGAKRILVGLGGSATTDGGLGALRALYPLHRYNGAQITCLCDVRTGFVDAAEVFAPQKGASPAQVELLRRRLERLADVYEADYGVDVRELEGAGAAGGLAGGLAVAGAQLESGFEAVADEVGLADAVEGADLVITAEGFLDEQSFDGKVVGGVAELAASLGVPCVAIVGEVVAGLLVAADGTEADGTQGDGTESDGTAGGSTGSSDGDAVAAAIERFGVEVVSLVERFGEDRARGDTVACIEAVVRDLLADRR